jgi:amidase
MCYLCRDYGSRLGHPEHSQFTVVKTDFYADIKTYLSLLAANPNNIRNLEDIVAYNTKHTGKEGGIPGTHPAWASGQDSFEMSLASRGVKGEAYHTALKYIRQKSREEGIDAALNSRGEPLDGLLVPLHAIEYTACQVAAKAGNPRCTALHHHRRHPNHRRLPHNLNSHWARR